MAKTWDRLFRELVEARPSPLVGADAGLVESEGADR
jgi:hypothetical protein